MNRLLVTLLTLFMVSSLAAAEEYAQATFPVKEHDFGYIKESGGLVSCEFEFVNTGSKPLIIVEAVASCGCTRPDYPKRPIEPGKKGKIKVTYNPLGRPGGFKKDVKVRTNGKEKLTVLYIIGSTIPSKNEK